MIAVDTSAIIALLQKEPGYEHLLDKLVDRPSCISAGTLTELYIVAEAKGVGEEARQLLKTFRTEVIPHDEYAAAVALRAYKKFGKGRHKASLNFGDCFSYALAHIEGYPLLFVGDDFTHTDLQSALT